MKAEGLAISDQRYSCSQSEPERNIGDDQVE